MGSQREAPDDAEITNESCKVSAPMQDGIRRVPGCGEGGNPADTGWQFTPAGSQPASPAPPCLPPGIASREPLLQPPACPPRRLNLITADTHLLLGSKTRSSQLKDSQGHGKLVLIAALMVVWPMSSPKWP